MKNYYYQFTSAPLDFFGVVMLSDIVLPIQFITARHLRRRQPVRQRHAHPSPRQAKLNPSKKAKAKKAKSAKKCIKLKKDMKTLYYKCAQLPLKYFGGVNPFDSDTLNPASSTRKDQRCIVEPAHPSPQQAKLKHRRTPPRRLRRRRQSPIRRRRRLNPLEGGDRSERDDTRFSHRTCVLSISTDFVQ